MKILITGGCGFLGSNLAADYLAQGWDVFAIDALFREGAQANLAWLKSLAKEDQFHHEPLDTADEAGVGSFICQNGPFDYVAHLAGQVAMTTSLADPRRDLLTNVVGTFNVLEAVRRHCPNALFAYSSTNKVYGDLGHLEYAEGTTRYTARDFPNGFDESLPLDFASPYGCSKGAADQYVRDWRRNYGLKTVVFRHSSIYGGRQYATRDQGWIGWFCSEALKQRRAQQTGVEAGLFTISGTGKQVRDVLHAEDLVRLYRAAYDRRDAIAGEIFNIGGGVENSLSLLELFSLLESILEMKAPLRYGKLARRQSDQDFFVANITKARQLLGFSPRVGKRQGIEAMLNWVETSSPCTTSSATDAR